MTGIASTSQIKFSFDFLNFSCPNFWLRFNSVFAPEPLQPNPKAPITFTEAEIAAHSERRSKFAASIVGFKATVYPEHGFKWTYLEQLTRLEALETGTWVNVCIFSSHALSLLDSTAFFSIAILIPSY